MCCPCVVLPPIVRSPLASGFMLLCCSCPEFTMNTVRGSTDVSDCTCEAGYEGADGTACSPCPYGHYSSYNKDAATSMCRACPANSNTTEEGAASVGECLCMAGYQGTIASTTEGECQMCPRGFFKSSLGSLCTGCPYTGDGAATLQTGSTSDADCACTLGQYRNESGCQT